MKKVFTFVSVIAVAAMLTSCSVTRPYTVSAAPIGTKVGHSETGVLFGIFYLNKDWGVIEAAKNGGIKNGVATVDIKTSWFPIVRAFYYKQEFIVTGE